MLSDAERTQAIDALLQAAQTRKPCTQLSSTWPNITIDDSYAISSAIAQRRIDEGAKLIGHKIGLTSKVMQQSSQIDEPDYGHILDYMLVRDGGTVEHAAYCIPRVEPELSFVLDKPLKGPGLGVLDVLRATEYVIPTIEIIDARVQNPRKIFDTVADNGAAAGVVLGGRPVRPHDIDLSRVGVAFYRNAEIEETGLSVGVLGHPALAVAWLANKLAPFGTALEPGHLILSGSFTRPVWADPGDTLHADFGDLGNVTVRFA